MTTESTIKRTVYLDILRIIAIFAVVWLHTAAQDFRNCYPSDEWMVKNVYDTLSRWAVPVFVMISGALFLDAERRVNTRRLFSHNILRLVVIYVVWSTVLTLHKGVAGMSIGEVVQKIIDGPIHLWFLKMLIGLYVLVPILRVITRKRTTEEYFLAVVMVMGIVIPTVAKLLQVFCPAISESFSLLIDSFELTVSTRFVTYFVLGHYLHRFSLTKRARLMIYMSAVMSVVAVTWLTAYASSLAGKTDTMFYDCDNVFTLFESIAVFIAMRNARVSKNIQPTLTTAARLSLGVYVLHIPVLTFFIHRTGGMGETMGWVLFVPGLAIVVFICTYVAVAILGKIPGIRKLVM